MRTKNYLFVSVKFLLFAGITTITANAQQISTKSHVHDSLLVKIENETEKDSLEADRDDDDSLEVKVAKATKGIKPVKDTLENETENDSLIVDKDDDDDSLEVKVAKATKGIKPVKDTLENETENDSLIVDKDDDDDSLKVKLANATKGIKSVKDTLKNEIQYDSLQLAKEASETVLEKLKATMIQSIVSPNPSITGEGSITIESPITEKYTLNVYSTSTLVFTEAISGGTTLFPALSQGFYYYKVINSSGQVVSGGRIMVVN